MGGAAEGGSRHSNLALRIASALVLAPLAIAATYFGGWPFAVFWGAAAVAIVWEWMRLADPGRGPAAFMIGALTVAIATGLAQIGHVAFAALAAALGALAAAAAARAGRPVWAGSGVVYAAAMPVGIILLRADVAWGLLAVVALFAIVWGTDILGYFVGRAVGGPKLAPSISPKKTWSGALAGLACAMIVGAVVAHWSAPANTPAIIAVALLLSIASQAGDLFESGIKRRFDAKDASSLIPGHGGVMDRLDGFWAATLVAAILGVVRGGLEAPARGLLVW